MIIAQRIGPWPTLQFLLCCCVVSIGCEELGIKVDGTEAAGDSTGTAGGDEATPPPVVLENPGQSSPTMSGTSDTVNQTPEQFAAKFKALPPNKITDADLLEAAENPELRQNLNSLDLRAAPITADGLSAVAKLTGLRELNLAGTVMGPGDWQALGEVSQLETLNLESAAVSDTTLGFLEQLVNLKRLRLTNCNLTDIPFQHMKNLRQLEELDLNGIQQFSGAGMEFLGPSGARAPLRVLTATNTNFGVFGFQFITRLKSLEVFAAGSADVTDAGLAALKGNSDLRVLQVGGNAISDQGLRQIGGFKALEDLDISGSQLISNATLRRLTGLKQLKRLNIEGTSCDLNGVQALKKALPDCRIRFGGMEY